MPDNGIQSAVNQSIRMNVAVSFYNFTLFAKRENRYDAEEGCSVKYYPSDITEQFNSRFMIEKNKEHNFYYH